MYNLNLKNLKIELPKDFNGNPTNVQIIEWLEYNLGARNDIAISNPLCDFELSDCNVSFSEVTMNGKPVMVNMLES